MEDNRTANRAASREELERLVAETDLGGRQPAGLTAKLLTVLGISWSLFQLWYASPLPFALNFGIFNDTEARAFHLAFAFALAFIAYPAFARSPRHYVPIYDWVLAVTGIAAVLYLVVFYRELSLRPGLPMTTDVVAAVVGVVVLLEAARRAQGPWLPLIAIVGLLYVFAGPYLPAMLSHRGASLSRAASHFWLTSEGVFGVALGVSTNFIFLFVLFGALLERAGAGNWFIQIAFALLGKYRGGPAKAAVMASGLTGVISGSSVANVVTTGTFTIPLMKRVGYTPVKAGAIETASSVNGQIMPPVMGAAAFIMAEYVGISYAQVCLHALVPALLTYGALFYVVDLEAAKAGMSGLPSRSRRGPREALIKAGFTLSSLIILANIVYFGLGWTKSAFGESAGLIILAAGLALYVGLVRQRAKSPDLAADDPAAALATIPDFYEVARTGLHYLIPVVTLIWCLIIEEMSPGLAAFWGVMAMVALLLTQGPLTALFRGQSGLTAHWRQAFVDLLGGLETGARNMIGVGLATAAAGVLVGTVTLTGIGLVMTEIVETVSGGNITIMLMLVAVICIILGTGLPTTANYVVVATLMAPVVVDLAAQNDLAIPLIAAHMFVFYYGLMADVTPPVGLASYAAAAVTGADPIKVGWQAIWYEARTALLPFIFIFNPAILMIGIEGPVHFTVVVGCAVLAMLAFCAAMQGYMFTRSRLWETIALFLICFTLFRPGFWMDMIAPQRVERPVSELIQVMDTIEPGRGLVLRLETTDIAGDPVLKVARLTLGEPGEARARLNATGVNVASLADPIITGVRPGSEAARLKLRPGDRIMGVLALNDRPSPFWFAVPAIALLMLVIFAQRRRMVTAEPAPARA
jgi:TRAP transporter 4TM/12TM fusion protein